MIAVSRALGKEVQRSFGVVPKVIYNAVDLPKPAPPPAAEMGKAGRTSVLRRFNWDDIACQTVAVYRGVAK